MSETVVVLSPDRRGEENVERRHLSSPFNFVALFDPFAVLVDHGVDDVDEGLIAVEQPMSTGQDVTFEPALDFVKNELTSTLLAHLYSMLGENLHHPALVGKIAAIFILFEELAHPHLLASLFSRQ